MMVIYVILLSVVSAGACVLLAIILRSRNKRRLFSASRGIACDGAGSIGISVVCSGVRSLDQVENLLSVEYARYEVVVVLDAWRYPDEFGALAARYRMIGVEYAPSSELPVEGVRSLGRSRKRQYRRLVLVDRRQDTCYGDFDAAVGVASYDHVLPVLEGQYLMPDAIERLVAELGHYRSETLLAVRSWVGEPMTLLSREAVMSAGGFGRRPVHRVPCRNRIMLWEPFFARPRPNPGAEGKVWGRVAGALLLAGGIAVSAATGRWYLAALLLTLAVVWSVLEYASLALKEVAGPGFGSAVAWRRYLHKLCVKNFTMS